ncbi:MFS transporter [Haloarcula sp. JP-L23]|uniref:MFS transporter n=1 Tax=Haloarcula sp. JP-L23 TaxID=2716717 RepID=UPI00140ECA79|nr:MFS transporter [Haloarcula sp. JP-L23]
MNRECALSVLACSLVSVGFFASLIAPASILPLLVTEFGITSTVAGLSISAVYAGWLLFQLPTGYLIDRVEIGSLMAVSVSLFVAAVFAGSALNGYTGFLLSRFVAGITGGVLFTASNQIVGEAVPVRHRGKAVTVFTAGAPVGFLLGQMGSPLVAERYGWSVVFPVFALVTLVGYLLFRQLPGRYSADAESISLRGFVQTVSDETVLLVSLAAFCTNSMYLFLNSWIPTFASDVHSLPLAEAGGIAALIPLMAIVARPSGGWLSDRIGHRRRPVVLASFLLSVPAFALLVRPVDETGFAVLLLTIGFSLQLAAGLYFTYVQELVPTNVTGTSLSVLTTFAVGGALVAPIAGGWLIDEFSWYAAFLANILLGVVGIVAIVVVTESPGTG